MPGFFQFPTIPEVMFYVTITTAKPISIFAVVLQR